MRIVSLLGIAIYVLLLVLPCSLMATDHNEPDLVSGFYRDRDGSGTDIYGVFAYPDESGENLNFVFTLAPVPETGRFDPNSYQRIYFAPGQDVRIQADKFLAEFKEEDGDDERRSIFRFIDKVNPIKSIREGAEKTHAFVKYVAKPIVQTAGKMLADGVKSNSIPVNQRIYPEIRLTYSLSGTWAKIQFRNFNLPGGAKTELVARSNGVETNPDKLKYYDHEGIKVFVGGRDDPFFADIGGFFRSINWRAALDNQDNFIWKGSPSYKDSGAKKESGSKPKRLLARDKGEGVYNGKDWREGNNINAVVMKIPLRYIVKDTSRDKLLRIWAESFLTEEAYALINK